jgi:putative ABC transport system permease protein
MTVSLAGSQHSTSTKRLVFFDELLGRVESLPGVQSASAINHLPLGGDTWGIGFAIEGRPLPPPGERPGAVYRIVRPHYFQTMGATLLEGRDFTERDNESAPGVVIINETFARRHWPNEDPIGKRIRIAIDESGPREIVGVVKDVKQRDWTAEPQPEMYLPHFQAATPRYLTLVVRADSNPLKLAAAVEGEVWAIDKNLPVSEVRSMEEVIAASIAQQRFNVLLLGIFASVALILAAVGIYGVMSYSVTQRTQEIGIRMALGAQTSDVLKMVVGQVMKLVAVGVGAGLIGAFLLTRLLSSLLYKVSATDPATFAVIALVLMSVALLACYLPARRATKVDPMVALRYE